MRVQDLDCLMQVQNALPSKLLGMSRRVGEPLGLIQVALRSKYPVCRILWKLLKLDHVVDDLFALIGNLEHMLKGALNFHLKVSRSDVPVQIVDVHRCTERCGQE